MGARTYWQQHRRTIGTVLLAVPCVNFFAQFLFSTPSYSSTEAVLQVEGLVCALMLAVALGLPGTVSVTELRAADQFFGWFRDPAGPPPTPEEQAAMDYYKTIGVWWRDRPPSFLFGYYLAISGFCLSVAILVIIIQYVYLSQARGLSPPGTDLSSTMKYFYRANVLVFLAVLGLIGAGIVTFFNAVCFMLYIKWPDYAVMYGANGDNGTTDLTVYKSVDALVVALAIAVGVLAILSGMAQVFIFRASPQAQKGGAKVAPGGDGGGGEDGEGGADGGEDEGEEEGGGKGQMRPMFGARRHEDDEHVKAGGVAAADVVRAGGGGSGRLQAGGSGGSGKLRQPAEVDS